MLVVQYKSAVFGYHNIIEKSSSNTTAQQYATQHSTARSTAQHSTKKNSNRTVVRGRAEKYDSRTAESVVTAYHSKNTEHGEVYVQTAY